MIIGHERIISFLTSSVKSNRLAHAYLFIGPAQVGKKTVALEFAKALQCEKREIKTESFSSCGQCQNCLLISKNQHPDVLLVEAGVKILRIESRGEHLLKSSEIKIEQSRQIQHQISLSCFLAKYKVVIIDGAEQMTSEAANCLLKTLEEPPPKSLLILISSSWQRILPTIVSRCQLIKFLPVKKDLIAKGLQSLGFKDKLKVQQAIRICSGRPGAGIQILNDSMLWQSQQQILNELRKLLKKDLGERFHYAHKLSQDNVEAQKVLSQWLIWFRDQMLARIGANPSMIWDWPEQGPGTPLIKISEIIKNIQWTQHLLNENGFNARLILENLMLKL